MNKRNLIILIIILIVVGIAIFSLSRYKKSPQAVDVFPNEEKATVFNTEEIDIIANQLNDLSPEDPVSGGSWHISQVAVIDKEHVYIVYEDGHIARRMLLEKTDQAWQRLAYFEPGKDMWKLISGNDPYMGNDVTVYEKSKEGEWVLHGASRE